MTDRLTETLIEIGLAAAVVAVTRGQPQILVARSDSDGDGLPYGNFDPLAHRTLEIALRDFVTAQTGLSLGYVEQLYTFADRGRHTRPDDCAPHVVSIGYLALTRIAAHGDDGADPSAFRSWYSYFPWEDWREGRPAILDREIVPRLSAWASDHKAERADTHQRALLRFERLKLAFGIDPSPWDEEKVLDRYELLYEAGLIFEAIRDGRPGDLDETTARRFGLPMRHDHRRILATAMGRLRAKLKYRPVVFELMASDFTLTALQQTLESISGHHVHKQNFRRLVETSALVEPTGQQTTTRGRPAALFRFRRDVLQERPSPGLRVGVK
ncbi:MAG: NAD regulator [Alphaproteobacteria bacterium]|nr:NAD regulator [Alphaproteobacteria bacterium]